MFNEPRRIVWSETVTPEESTFEVSIEGWESEVVDAPIVGITTEIVDLASGRMISSNTTYAYDWDDMSRSPFDPTPSTRIKVSRPKAEDMDTRDGMGYDRIAEETRGERHGQ